MRNTRRNRRTSVERAFAAKFTENGDMSYSTTGNVLLDILFMSEYFQNHLQEVPHIGTDEKAKLFAMFMRDPRFGIGRRDLGRVLMKDAENTLADIVLAGRYDDVWQMFHDDTEAFHRALDFLKVEIQHGNELAKKWMPRYSSKNLLVAREIAKYWGMNKQQYGHFVKAASTVEEKLSRHQDDEIDFSKLPSLALLKYQSAFKKKETTSECYAKFVEDVKSGKVEMHVTTTTPYDLYRNANKLGADTDVFFEKLTKISGSWVPVIDTSGSMFNANDAIGKAMSIGHYLAKTSTYLSNKAIIFSDDPYLVELGATNKLQRRDYGCSASTNEELYEAHMRDPWYTERAMMLQATSQYAKEIRSMYAGYIGESTDFGKMMEMLRALTPDDAPEYIVVLSDMEFNRGSNNMSSSVQQEWREKGINTKIIWWNFNERNATTPEMDDSGNIYMSGYNPMLLQFLESGFDGNAMLDKLLAEYRNFLQKAA